MTANFVDELKNTFQEDEDKNNVALKKLITFGDVTS